VTALFLTLVVVFLPAGIFFYNRLVGDRNLARQGFADIDVQQYLTRIETFPDLVVAKLFGFQPMPFFHTDEREPVRVSLAS
jgi:hypothetical protein